MITKTRPKSQRQLDDTIVRRAMPKTKAQAQRFADGAPGPEWDDFLEPGLTSTTTPGGIEANGNGHGGAASEQPGTPGIELVTPRQIDLAAIVVSKDNPRTTFDEEKLKELAASLIEHGLLQPLLVRPLSASAKSRSKPHPGGPGFELVAGERRYRAAKLAGLKSVRAEIVALTDAQAAEIRLEENLQREDLTAIEEAQAYRRMIDELGYTQERLAGKLHCSQPHVANRLRLLKLPKAWQARIISREIPATHARVIAAYAGQAMILKELEERFFCKHYPEPIGNLAQFTEQVHEYAAGVCCAMEGEHYFGAVGKRVKVFTPTAADREKLAIIEIDGCEYATNTKLWGELRKKQIDALVDGKTSKGGKGKPAEAKEPKRSRTEEKAAAEKQARQLKRWVDEWRTNWLRYLLSRRVVESWDLAARVAIMAMAKGRNMWGVSSRVAELLGPAAGKRLNPHGDGLAAAIATTKEANETLIQLAADWLWTTRDEPSMVLDAKCVEALAEAAAIDLDVEWKKDLAGPLTEAFFNRHPKAVVERWANALGVGREGASKTETIDLVVNARELHGTIPTAIKPVVPIGAGTRGPAKKGKAKPTRKSAKRKAAAR